MKSFHFYLLITFLLIFCFGMVALLWWAQRDEVVSQLETSTVTTVCNQGQWVVSARTSQDDVDEFQRFDMRVFDTEAEEDLDGDGKTERITFIPPESRNLWGEVEKSKLMAGFEVNGIKELNVLGLGDGFEIIDIDKTDKFKEIAIHSGAPSSDHHYRVFRFENEQIIPLGGVVGSIIEPLAGTGRLTLKYWRGFWLSTEEYVLNPDKTQLVKVPRDYIPMDLKAVTSKALLLAKSPENQRGTVLICAGEEVRFTQMVPRTTEGDGWYKIELKNGMSGWATEFTSGSEFNISEKFADLQFAD